MKKLAILTLLFTSVNFFAQSPWTKNKDEGYVQLSYTTISNYDKLFGKDNDIILPRKISDNTLQLYGEYGLTDKTTLLTVLPLKILSGINDKIIAGNIQLGVKHNFYNKKWLISGQLNVEMNISEYDATSGLRSGYDAWTFTPMVLAGRGFDRWYIQAFTGVDLRTNDYSSSFKLGGEMGYKAIDWLWIAGFLDGVASLKNGDIMLPAENLATGLYVNDQSFAAFGLKFIGEFNDSFGANIGFGGAFAGRRVAKAPAISFGLYQKF
ncbi:hypothetical protein H3Z83_09470 [Tenacibaculum sp. S7007]|uniref:Transporter n=1 Tax=Tenacibaculum pelagium TaxID=2759527 RepID=A0A839ANR4_9FLAO|nr:hypothetical protein [Tenacibaculum pelagium]MBA6156742.1 hypothetical protein [Tenacibaculum pelagium]